MVCREKDSLQSEFGQEGWVSANMKARPFMEQGEAEGAEKGQERRGAVTDRGFRRLALMRQEPVPM